MSQCYIPGIRTIFFFRYLQPGLEYNSTTQEYTGTPTMSACKAQPKKGKKRKHDGETVEDEEDEEEPSDTDEQVEKEAEASASEASTAEPKDLVLATHAMSIMICGLTKRYKHIVGFHLTDATFDANECADFIKEAILKVNAIGYKVKAVVMDMSTLNIAV